MTRKGGWWMMRTGGGLDDKEWWMMRIDGGLEDNDAWCGWISVDGEDMR